MKVLISTCLFMAFGFAGNAMAASAEEATIGSSVAHSHYVYLLAPGASIEEPMSRIARRPAVPMPSNPRFDVGADNIGLAAPAPAPVAVKSVEPGSKPAPVVRSSSRPGHTWQKQTSPSKGIKWLAKKIITPVKVLKSALT